MAVWQAIYGPDSGFLALLAATRDPGTPRFASPRTGYFLWPAFADHAARWLLAQSPNRELYHTAHLLTQPRRLARNAAPFRALYADLDSAEVGSAVPPPTLLVETSPGRHQAYWALVHPVAPDLGLPANRQLTYRLGADRSGWDATQLLRIPGTRNHKYPDAPLVRIVQWHDYRYRLDELVQPEPLPPPRPPRQSAPPPPAWSSDLPAVSQAPGRLSTAAQRVWNGDAVIVTADGRIDRSASLVRIARLGLALGYTGDVLAALLAVRDAALGWRKYCDRPDAARQYAAIVQLVTTTPPGRR